MDSQFKQPRAGDFDTLPVGAGAVTRAEFAETRCPGILKRAGETFAYARKTLVREMDESLRAFTRVCVKKNPPKYNFIYLKLLDEREQGHCPGLS